MFYAELAGPRQRQRLLDLAVIVWAGFWLVIARRIYVVLERLRKPGDTIQSAGEQMADWLGTIADIIDKVPFAGGELKRPFEGVANAAAALGRAGEAQSTAVHDTAFWIATMLIVVPIGAALLWHVPRRVMWVRRARDARKMREGHGSYLLALRGLGQLPLKDLAKFGERPSIDDPKQSMAIANRYLESLGLRPYSASG